jgi:hypothetical protein
MISYEVGQALDVLDKRADVTMDDIARHEIMLFPLLEDSERHLRVFDVLAENADLYFEVIKAVFRGDNEPEVKAEASEHDRAAARLSYSLLSEFDQIPGNSENGICVEKLTHWIDRVRELAVQNHRVAISDQYIGHVLAHAAIDKDGAWPAVAVRDEIERLRSEQLERGIAMERFNMRGVHYRSITGGGDQERALAKQYSDYAAAMSNWPRTQRLLRAIAGDWKRDAVREDEWAEQRKSRA